MTEVTPPQVTIPTPTPIAEHVVSPGREITYFNPVTGKPAGVTSSGGTFYSIGREEDVLFRSPTEAQTYAARRGQSGQLVGVSNIPSAEYWAQKTAQEQAAQAAYGGVRTEAALAPVGTPTPGLPLATKVQYLERGTGQWATEEQFKKAVEQVGQYVPVSAKGEIVTAVKPQEVIPIPSPEKMIYPGISEFAGYKPIDVSGLPVIAVKPTRIYIEPPKYLLDRFYEYSKELSRKGEEYGEKYVLPIAKYTPPGLIRPKETEQLARGVISGVATTPEFAATVGLGTEMIARDIITGKPVKEIGGRIGTGASLLATGIVTQFKEKPIETTGQFIGQSLVFGGVAKGIKEIKIPEIKTKGFGALELKYIQPKSKLQILPSKYPEEIGFTGELMGYKEAKVRIPEITPTTEGKAITSKLMGFEQAKINIPETIKSIEKTTNEPTLMGFKEAKPIQPEVIPTIKPSETPVLMSFKEAKVSVPSISPKTILSKEAVKLMGFKEAKTRIPETEIMIREAKTTAGGEARAKAYMKTFEQAQKEVFEPTGGAVTSEMYLRGTGIRPFVPPKVAEPVFDIVTGGESIRTALKSGSKIKPYYAPPKITDVITIEEIAKKPTEKKPPRIRDLGKEFQEREKKLSQEMKRGGFQITGQGQIVLLKEPKVETRSKSIEKQIAKQEKALIKQAVSREPYVKERRTLYPFIIPVSRLPSQIQRPVSRTYEKELIKPLQIPTTRLERRQKEVIKSVLGVSALSSTATKAGEMLKTISIMTPITSQAVREAQKTAQKQTQIERQIEKQLQTFEVPPDTIIRKKLKTDEVIPSFWRKRRKPKKKSKVQKVRAPVLHPLWDVGLINEAKKSFKIIDITKKQKKKRR